MALFEAKHRFADISPLKVRDIAKLIRRQTVAQAEATLKFLPQRGARLLEKVLLSAAANAADQGGHDPEDLTVIDARVDEGPRLKRIRPHARGMAFPILKRMCHIKVTIEA